MALNKTDADHFNMATYGLTAKAAHLMTELTAFFQRAHGGLEVDGKLGVVTVTALTEVKSEPIPKYDTMFWQEHLRPFCEAENIPLVYALRWVEIESGGNPCAIGAPGQLGPDGYPRELGIAQFYNPDDLTFLHLTGHGLRAYCGKDNKPNRALTPAEVKEQAEATVDLIAKCRGAAARDLAKVGATWSEHDELCLTKLQHGLPGLSRSGLPAVTKQLGRAPKGWDEFAATLNQVTLDPGTERYRGVIKGILENARSTASVVK